MREIASSLAAVPSSAIALYPSLQPCFGNTQTITATATKPSNYATARAISATPQTGYTGRYTSPDPLLRVEPVSWDTPSPYDYAGNNPINHFDDLGLFTKCVKPSSYQNIGPLSLLHHQPFFKPSWLFNLFWYDADCGNGQCCDQKMVNPTVVPDAVSGSAPWASAIGFAAPTIQFVKWVKEPCHAQIGVSTKTTFNLLFGMASFQQFGQHIQVCFDCEKK